MRGFFGALAVIGFAAVSYMMMGSGNNDVRFMQLESELESNFVNFIGKY